jgi:2-polyprenyl-3-methyl-5-hydroxy-6-metoxy-1,4-benzoquinol methylase
MTFKNSQESHEHSLETLNLLYEYDDFMRSIKTVADIGCGQGLDLEWWATRTTRDDDATPLNIECIGVDIVDQVHVAKKISQRYLSKN